MSTIRPRFTREQIAAAAAAAHMPVLSLELEERIRLFIAGDAARARLVHDVILGNLIGVAGVMRPVARVALRLMFVVTELLGDLELAPTVARFQQRALDGAINTGAALEQLVTVLRGIERRAGRRFRPSAKAATRRPKKPPARKPVTDGKKGRPLPGRGR